MGKSWRTYRKLHRWPGLIISILLLYYALTGIIMNHRSWLAGVDLDRDIMPSNYNYVNWNNAALKGSLSIGPDSILVYGNIGIWLTDSTFSSFVPFTDGFPGGIDNRKISDIHMSSDGNLYAAALTGLYAYDTKDNLWHKFEIDDTEERFTGLESTGDTIYALNRSCLFRGISSGISTKFEKIQLPAPPGYDNKITLFETIWQIHSGEVFGVPGKVYVDVLGFINIFLSVTGIIWFFFPGWIKSRSRRNIDSKRILKTGKWSLRWHNRIGAWTFVLLIIVFLTGAFLRPPLLIAIGESRVLPLKYTHLDQPNPWYDKLRDITYDKEKKTFLLAASDGIYKMDPGDLLPVRFGIQPPVSVMGITVFEKYDNGHYLIGSFSGLYLWDPANPEIFDFITGLPYREAGIGRPVGDFKITGLIHDTKGRMFIADYSSGIVPLQEGSSFPEMPANMLSESRISLWNLCLEIHTGRIFEKFIGAFYILIVPLTGITGIIIVISGYILWRRKYRRQGYENINNN